MLMASEMNTPVLINNICARTIRPKTNKSTLERFGGVSQFLVRQKYKPKERKSAVKKIHASTAKLENLLSPVDLKKASNLISSG